MKKIILFSNFLFSVLSYSQVGINNEDPKATLDVTGKPTEIGKYDGIIAPRIARDQLLAKTYTTAQTGALVYVNGLTASATGQVINVTAIGYYYFDGSLWQALGGAAPAVDTSIYSGNGTLSSDRTVTQLVNKLAFSGYTGAATDAFSVDGTTFSVDALNDRVGLGTITPLTKLHIVAQTMQGNRYNLIDAPASTNQFALLALRNTSPLAAGNYSLLGFTNNGPASGGANWGIGSIRTGASSTTGSEEDFYIGNSLGGNLLERFRINSAGNVGIGTSLPQRILHVNANTNPIRFENLPILPVSTVSTGLVIDANGDIYKNNTSGAVVDTSIYSGNGTLSSDRTVTQAGKKLNFTGGDFIIEGSTPLDGPAFNLIAGEDKIGINSSTPDATLDVEGKPSNTTASDGIIAPRITKQQLAAKNANVYDTFRTGAMVYVTNVDAPTGTIPSFSQVVEVTAVGYYYFNGLIWKALSGAAATSDISIYSSNGTLSSDRTVTQAANKLTFSGYTGSATDAFSVDGSTFSVDAVNNRVGIGTNAPLRQLHVTNAAAGSPSMRLDNLPALPSNTSSTGIVIDANGDVYKNSTTSVEGQILRIGLNGTAYNAGTQAALRFNANNDASEMGNAPNSAPNFINTIVGVTMSEGVPLGAGTNGSFLRTTDQINLPPGVYKVQVRLVGNFASSSTNNTLFIKAIVNNNEYSLINGSNGTGQPSVYYFDDYINITGASSQPIDFAIQPTSSNFTIASSATPGTGNSYRSLIMIQRLR